MKYNMMKILGTLVLVLALMLTIIPDVKAESYTASSSCADLVASFEPCTLTAKKDPAGVWCIGYNHTKDVTANSRLADEAEALELLKQDLDRIAGYVNKFISNGTIRFEMNQNRFDALVAFAFNCGSGNLEKLVKGNTAETVAVKILGYNRGGGKVLPTLTARRQAERDLFIK